MQNNNLLLFNVKIAKKKKKVCLHSNLDQEILYRQKEFLKYQKQVVLGFWQHHKLVTIHTGCQNMQMEVYSPTKETGYYRYLLMCNVKEDTTTSRPQNQPHSEDSGILCLVWQREDQIRGKGTSFLFSIICLTREINRTSTTKRVRMQPVNVLQQIKK